MTDELRRSGNRRAVHLERDYNTGPEDLWLAWTEPERLARWLGTPTGPVLTATGPVRLVMGPEENDWVDISVITAIPPELLELRWEFFGEPGGLLRVQMISISPGTTRLIVDHDGLDASSAGYGAGWQAFLEGPLADHLGLGVGEGETSWDTRFTSSLPIWRERAATLT